MLMSSIHERCYFLGLLIFQFLQCNVLAGPNGKFFNNLLRCKDRHESIKFELFVPASGTSDATILSYQRFVWSGNKPCLNYLFGHT